jgi:hypothetical protein
VTVNLEEIDHSLSVNSNNAQPLEVTHQSHELEALPDHLESHHQSPDHLHQEVHLLLSCCSLNREDQRVGSALGGLPSQYTGSGG